MTPEDLQREREALIAEIASAFAGVTREGGMSWGESVAADGSTPEHEAEALALDTDRSWEELIDNPTWLAHPGTGGFYFVDFIGFRYYLPAAMTRSALGDDQLPKLSAAAIVDDVSDHLELLLRTPRHSHIESYCSNLNEAQRRAIARFVRFKIAEGDFWISNDLDHTMWYDLDSWGDIYEQYWQAIDHPPSTP